MIFPSVRYMTLQKKFLLIKEEDVMKNIPFKDGFIYNAMKRHRIKHIIRTALVFAILFLYVFFNRAYIGNVLFGSSQLDSERFVNEVSKIEINKELAAKSDGSHIIRSYAVKSGSYWQDQKYEFDVSFTDVYKLPITYTTRNTGTNYDETDSKAMLSANLYRGTTEGINVLVLAYPHQEIKDGEAISGIFTEMSNIIRTDAALLGSLEGESFCEFIFDTRGLEMGSEKFDITLSGALLLFLIYLLIKMAIYFINPYLTPTYKSLAHYGDLETVVRDIENQLTIAGVDKITRKKPAVTDDWIVSQDSFKLKIVKNHAKAQDSSRYGSRL